MRTIRLRLCLDAAVACAVLRGVPALAQGTACADGGTALAPGTRLDSFPAANATGVPVDGFLRVRYQSRVPLPATLTLYDRRALRNVPGQTRVVGSELVFQSDAPLAPASEHAFVPPDVSGMSDAIVFTTGTERAGGQRLLFDGIHGASFTRPREQDLCGDPGAIEVTTSWYRASGTAWGATDVEYVVYETRGPGISGALEVARQRGGPDRTCEDGASQCLTFRLPSASATARVCFNVQALDPYGVADGNAVEACVDPQVGGFFYGCRAAPGHVPGPMGSVPAALWAAVAAVGFARRRGRARCEDEA